MKLAEALAMRTDLQKRIERISAYLKSISRLQEDEEPEEAPKDMMRELEKDLKELEILTVKINRTNLLAPLEDGTTITEKMAKRDHVRKHIRILTSLHDELSSKAHRCYSSDIRMVNTIAPKYVRTELDKLAKRLREINLEIQELNWKVELIE